MSPHQSFFRKIEKKYIPLLQNKNSDFSLSHDILYCATRTVSWCTTQMCILFFTILCNFISITNTCSGLNHAVEHVIYNSLCLRQSHATPRQSHGKPASEPSLQRSTFSLSVTQRSRLFFLCFGNPYRYHSSARHARHYFFTSILHDAFYAHFTRAFYILLNK